MADTLLQILMWAIPSGGIGAAIAWIANRRSRMTKTTKEVHDTYKVMYEDISRLLLATQKKYEETSEKIEELSRENARTRSALNRLSRAVEAIRLCPHHGDCPVRLELQDGEPGKLSSDDDCCHQRGKRKGGTGARMVHEGFGAGDRGGEDGGRGEGGGEPEGGYGQPAHAASGGFVLGKERKGKR